MKEGLGMSQTLLKKEVYTFFLGDSSKLLPLNFQDYRTTGAARTIYGPTKTTSGVAGHLQNSGISSFLVVNLVIFKQ